ncbi:MAG: energy transducer TonB [Burkholderiales bacterium]
MSPISWELGVALLLSAALHAAVAVLVPVLAPRAALGNAAGLTAWVVPSQPSPPQEAPAADAGPAATAVTVAQSESATMPPPSTPTATPEPLPPARVGESAAGAESGQPVADSHVVPVEPAGPALEIPVIEDPQFYPARLLDVLPRPTSDVPLKYPENAARGDVSGTVTLLLLIDELGVVVDATVLSAEPPGYFEEAAIESFRGILFRPGERNGRPVKSRLPVEVTFEAKTNSLKPGGEGQ